VNSSPPNTVSDADLNAYADGQLAPEQMAAVEAALARDPELAMRVAHYRAQSGLLRDALDPVLAESIPERLLAAASTAALQEPSLVRRWGIPSLAAAATLILGVGLGWFGRDAMIERAGTPTTFARSVAYAHALYAADPRRPVEVWAAEEKNLVSWLTKRLGFKVYAPDLNGFGYALVGGRLVAGNEFPTALFMYENADKERLSLQVRKQSAHRRSRAAPSGETAFRYEVENGLGVFYWIDDEDCGYAISGKLDRTQLLKLAHVVYAQLAVLEAGTSK
jgi:anti-sigma factor RsiW